MLVSSRHEAATLLCAARLDRTPIDALPDDFRPDSEADAYAVQDELHTLLSEAGWGSVVGHKIGCTTPVMQEYMDIDHPCSGGVFAPTVKRLSADFDFAGLVRPGVECELAVRLQSDLAPEGGPYDRRSVAGAVRSCMAAIELVDDRYVDYRSLGTPTLVADDFFGAGCVLSREDEHFDPRDLAESRGTMSLNGSEVGSGTGELVLGHPLDALAWLANNETMRGSSLRAGNFILLGSVVQTHWVEPGDEIVIVNDPFGEVRARFLP